MTYNVFGGTLNPTLPAAGSSAGIVFTHGPIFGFFAPQGRHVAPIKVKFGVEERTVGLILRAKFHLDRSKGGGLNLAQLPPPPSLAERVCGAPSMMK